VRASRATLRLTINFVSGSYQKGFCFSGRWFLMDKVELLKSSHSVGEASYHLQFTPKYRKPIFEDAVLKTACEQLFYGIAQELKIQIAGIGFGPDHVHMFVTGCKNYSASQLAHKFKGVSSKKIRDNYHDRLVNKELYGDHLWSAGYFHRTVGAVTNEAMQKYVNESQHKHWIAEKQKTIQTTILQFNN